MTPSTECYALVERFEGRKLRAYVCPAGKLTIGVGHTGDDVRAGMVISNADADRLLRQDLTVAALTVTANVKTPMSQGMFDALCSFVFNLGAGNFKSSSLLRLMNAGDYAGAAGEFDKWDNAHVNGKLTELPGLHTRRMAERELFLRTA